MLTYHPTPIQEIHDPIFDQAGVRLLVKREDLNHPFVSGNKWWKLKYNLEEVHRLGHKTLLTFGGAYSNHIYATAAAAKECSFKSIGIIRGEEALPLNSTLEFAMSRGMELHYISREAYRTKTDPAFIQSLHDRFGDFYLIPEGGTNELAVKGCAEFARTLKEIEFDFLCLAVGTGGTMAGMIQGLNGGNKIIGFPVLKGGEYLRDEIEKLLREKFNNWNLITDYHFGGYAKSNSILNDFVNHFSKDLKTPLDLVYTGKAMFGVQDLVSKKFFPANSVIFFVHTGGLRLLT